MKSIAYAIVSSSSFWLGCFAPQFADRLVMTGIGFACLVMVIYSKEPAR